MKILFCICIKLDKLIKITNKVQCLLIVWYIYFRTRSKIKIWWIRKKSSFDFCLISSTSIWKFLHQDTFMWLPESTLSCEPAAYLGCFSGGSNWDPQSLSRTSKRLQPPQRKQATSWCPLKAPSKEYDRQKQLLHTFRMEVNNWKAWVYEPSCLRGQTLSYHNSGWRWRTTHPTWDRRPLLTGISHQGLSKRGKTCTMASNPHGAGCFRKTHNGNVLLSSTKTGKSTAWTPRFLRGSLKLCPPRDDSVQGDR